jgi:hypothetical protein
MQELCSQLTGRNGVTFFSAAQCREACHGIGVQDVTAFHSDQCSAFCLLGESKKKKKKREREKWLGAFFPRAGHTLLTVPHGIFTAVRSN